MSRKPVWILLLVLMLGIVMTACTPAPAEDSNDNEAQETEAPDVEETDQPTPEETDQPAGEVALRWRTRPDNQEEADVYQNVSDGIDAEWDRVTLAYEPGGSETASYQDVLKTELAAG